jgi:protein SCO1/2
VDQRGNPVKFQSEAIGGRIVVIDFIYTRCTTVCPVLSQVLALVQDGLGDRLNGRDIRLVSISVDPAADTPERLNAFAVRFGAGPAWRWLTGRKHDIDRVLDGLGAYTPDFADHPSMVLVGDGRDGGWTRFYGFPSPDLILTKINELVARRNTSKTSWKTGD